MWLQQKEGSERVLDGERGRGRETETDRVHICFGSRVCSDGFLCQQHPNGAELKCETKSEKREAVCRGSRMGHTYEEPGGRKQWKGGNCVCVRVSVCACVLGSE